MHALKLTAADIASVTTTHNHGPLEYELLQLFAALKARGAGASLLVRVDYPGEPDGGLELRACRGNRWLWALWRWFGAPLEL